MRKATQRAPRTLEPREASTLALIAQYVSVHPGELPPDANELRASLGSDANRIVDALVRVSKSTKKSASTGSSDEYEEAADDLLNWVKTNKNYLQAK